MTKSSLFYLEFAKFPNTNQKKFFGFLENIIFIGLSRLKSKIKAWFDEIMVM